MADPGGEREVRLVVNGVERVAAAEPRLLLSDFLRHRLGLTGTHVGCEHGVCGACTVLLDGEPVRSCLVFAVQAEGAELRTVEGLAGEDGELGPVQRAFHEAHGMQCGFCTPGFLISLTALLEERPGASEEELVDALSGNLCRCTGYANILAAARAARDQAAERA
ncbi:MAG: (2Fe-2S)-binding protein [Actinobacteria bacterium]|nr:(2Fe-2S)-binding protein [Actinomycetota bacterium]